MPFLNKNVAGARAAVEEFWLALGEPMPESEVFHIQKEQNMETKIVINKTAMKRHTSQI